MKMNVMFTLFLVVAVGLAAGCEAKKVTGADALATQIAGSYKSSIFSGSTEFPGTTKFGVDKDGAITGTYQLTEQDGTVVPGKLTDFRTVGPNKLQCKWEDKNGTGDFVLTFKADMSSFEGLWNDDGSDEKHAWNGKK